LSTKISIQTGQKENRWRLAWSQQLFRKKIALGFALNIPILVAFPLFFQYIEHRKGTQLNDILLNQIPAENVSFFIFFIIWSMALLTLIRAINQPEIFVTFLYAFFFISISRMVTITLVPLDSPEHLIPLIDPLSNSFYGKSFVTKDLFYSGHVATQFLIYLCLKNRFDKILAILSTITVAVLVLIQHVHYSIDVLAAPPFAFVCFRIGRSIAKKGIKF